MPGSRRVVIGWGKDRRLRGHMIKVFKITHNIYDSEVSPNLRYYPKSNTRGNKYKYLTSRFTMIYANILSLFVLLGLIFGIACLTLLLM